MTPKYYTPWTCTKSSTEEYPRWRQEIIKMRKKNTWKIKNNFSMFNFVFLNDPKTESFQSQLRITDHHWCTQGTTNTRTFKMAGLLIFTTLKSKSGLQIWPGWKRYRKSFPAKDQSNQTDHCPSSKIFSPSMNSHLKLRRPSNRTMTTWYTPDQRKRMDDGNRRHGVTT